MTPTRRDLLSALVDSLQKAFPLEQADALLTHADISTVMANLEQLCSGLHARVPYDTTFTLHDDASDGLVMTEAMGILRRLRERGLADAETHGVIVLIGEREADHADGGKVDVASNLGVEGMLELMHLFLENASLQPKFVIDENAPIKH